MESPLVSTIFQQRVDPLSGQSEWVLLRADQDDADASMANTSYLDMLNDTERNQAFEAAITHTLGSFPGLVLDIGTGTGLLSMMAARVLRKAGSLLTEEKPLIACEAFLPMYLLAQKVLHLNGFSSLVHLVHKRSEDMKVGTDMISPADVLVTEILDSTLLGEGLIPTLQHAHDNLLKPGAHVIPHKATIFGQLVQCDHFWRMHDLQGVESQLRDGVVLHSQSQRLQPLQYAMHVDALMDKIELISQPFKVFEFDLSKRPSSYGKEDIVVKAMRTGVVHAIISWWVIQLDRKGMEFYSTAPKWVEQTRKSWHDHWKQCVWFVSDQGLHVVANEDVQLTASHDEISFKYNLISMKDLGHTFGNKANSEPLRFPMGPERIALLGSCKWRSIVMAALNKAVHCNSLCLVVDDSLPLAISAAAASSTAIVISLFPGDRESDFPVLKSMLDANGLDSDRVKRVKKKANELTIEDIGGRKVDILIGEPYYLACEDMVPWRKLRFWKERTCLAKLLSENAITIPCRGILYGMAMSMHDLWKSRQALQMVQGFNHSVVNKAFGAFGDLSFEGAIFPCYLWQCGGFQGLSEAFSIMTFELSRAIETVTCSRKVQISKSGTCHGIVLWIDWVMHPDIEDIIYTGPEGHEPTYWKQGVKLFRSPVEVKSKVESCDESVFHLHATFNSESGELLIGVEFL